jgi:hypothetical protein
MATAEAEVAAELVDVEIVVVELAEVVEEVGLLGPEPPEVSPSTGP